MDHVGRRDQDPHRDADRQMHRLGLGKHRRLQPRVAELEIELMADDFHRQGGRFGAEIDLVPDVDAERREENQQQRREDRPPQLELRRVVDLDADRVRRVGRASAEGDREIDDVARDENHNPVSEHRHELEESVDVGGPVGHGLR